jgi:hypothetical protein
LQRRWQDGCRIWPLLARGFGYTLDVVPGAVCTTACWTCQALIHVRDKLLSAYERHGQKKQETIAAQEAPAWIVGRWACRTPRRSPSAATFAGGPGRPAGPGHPAGGRPAPPGPAAAARCPGSSVGGSIAVAGCRHPARARALFPLRLAANRHHRRVHVCAADRRVDRAARPAPGVTFSGRARKPIA